MGERAAEKDGHPDVVDLVAFASGELDREARETVDEHLDGCPSCRGAIAALLVEGAAERTMASSGTTVHDTLSDAQSGDLPAGTRVDRYEVQRVIGRGGMGVIYEAHDPRLGRRVALKVMRDAFEGTASERLLREAQALAQVAHPNVVSVFDAGTAEGRVFLAMTLLEGGTLRAWIGDPARTRADVLSAMLSAGRGLYAAHERGLVHRDFKPENVLVGEGPVFVVTDFGLVVAADRDAPRPGGSLLNADLTRPGALMGTPAYMALEQLRGHRADPRADQFAFGVTLFEALFGRRPFAGRNIPELVGAVMRGAIDWTAPRFEVGELQPVLASALSASREDRHASMEPLLDALVAELGARRREWKRRMLGRRRHRSGR
ncbi:MAG: protein kinase [Polyangiaceae bacterium]